MAGIADRYLRRFQDVIGEPAWQGAPLWDGMTLIPGRECGDCTVCCTAPSINKPEIQKLSGAACRHCLGGGCAIYDVRPPVCRAFYCAWRTVDIFGDDWRPDKSGVLAYVETEGISEDFDVVIVSSTRGARPDQVTAITMLSHAEMLLQVAAMQSGAGGGAAVPPAASLEMLSSMGFGVIQ